MSQDARQFDHQQSESGPEWGLDVTERAGPPIANRRRRRAMRLAVLLALCAAAAWAWREGRLDAVAPLAWQLAQSLGPASTPKAVSTSAERADAPPPIEAREIASAEQVRPPEPRPERVPDAAHQVAATPPAQAAPESAAASATPQLVAPPAGDALGRRAEAVGLHPELSRALLARLSDDDYRNAAVAIRTALAETPDEGTLEWPARASPRLARFRVLFVAGAPERCRRYVVEIAKDGWLTTALPMERCGIAHPASRPQARPPLRQG